MHRKNDPKYKTEHQHNQQLKAQLILCQLFKVHSAHCFVFQKAWKFITSVLNDDIIPTFILSASSVILNT